MRHRKLPHRAENHSRLIHSLRWWARWSAKRALSLLIVSVQPAKPQPPMTAGGSAFTNSNLMGEEGGDLVHVRGAPREPRRRKPVPLFR